MSLARALVWLVTGLIVLVASSRVLVWGAVEAARWCGVSDLVIGLTVIAVGTSLPELASSIVAARKGEHDIALGNVIGSNLFNTLLVVGIAGAVAPFAADPEGRRRDVPVMVVLTLALFFLGIGIRKAGRIGRFKGLLLTLAYAAYTCWVAWPLLRPSIWPAAASTPTSRPSRRSPARRSTIRRTRIWPPSSSRRPSASASACRSATRSRSSGIPSHPACTAASSPRRAA